MQINKEQSQLIEVRNLIVCFRKDCNMELRKHFMNQTENKRSSDSEI